MGLKEIIANKIKNNNEFINFDEFMDLALYHQKYGYYRSNSRKIGKNGDFITAPETSDLFGFCLAKQIIDIYQNNNLQYSILEFGAGNGVMAAQILFHLKKENNLPEYYYILELSANLKEWQAQNIFAILPELRDRVVWLDKLPENFDGVMLANEVLDAMPTKRAIVKDNYFYEVGVGLENDEFVWKITDKKISNIGYDLQNGYINEFNLNNELWLKTLAGIAGNWSAILIDYGFNEKEFFHIDRKMGTLRCYKNHQADDNPLVDVGTKDITSWVNFSNIAKAAKSNNLKVLGYCTQAMFLISLGIDRFLMDEESEAKKLQLANEIKQLVFPNAMGESFKVLVISKNMDNKILGFKEQNLKHTL